MLYFVEPNYIVKHKEDEIILLLLQKKKKLFFYEKETNLHMHVPIWVEKSKGLMLCLLKGEAKYSPITGNNGCTLVPMKTPALFP
jgi:hypothetical protein